MIPLKANRKSIRLKGYDYSQAGLYFITICCQDRICRFGKIQNREMILNNFGKIAYDEWVKTPEIRKNVELHEFVIMPNHIHAIIRLFDAGVCNTPQRPFHAGVCDTPPRSPSQTIGAIVRGYKSSVTKQLRSLGFNEQLWQRNYYEHIICDERAYNNIAKYIMNNPAKWDDDKFYYK